MAPELWWRSMRKTLPIIIIPRRPLFRHRRLFYYYSSRVAAAPATPGAIHQQQHLRHNPSLCYHLARPPSPLPLLTFPSQLLKPPPLEHATPLLLLQPPLHSPRWLSSEPSKTKPPPTPKRTSERRQWNRVEPQVELWEKEANVAKEPKIGDGGDGGGIALQNVEWGQQVLSIAKEILQTHFQDTASGALELFAFRVSRKGYIYVRLDKLSDKYGCPSLEEIKEFNRLYYDHLEESGKRGEIPDNLAIEVSSPGAGRLLRVPDDLERFKDLPLTLKYLERDAETKKVTGKREGVFFLVSIDNDSKHCVWKLADVKENWDPLMKRKTLSRKNKDWRLDLPFQNIKKLTFYLKL